jgi:hypothetical protein
MKAEKEFKQVVASSEDLWDADKNVRYRYPASKSQFTHGILQALRVEPLKSFVLKRTSVDRDQDLLMFRCDLALRPKWRLKISIQE